MSFHRLYPNVVTWAGETPADLARRAGHRDVLRNFSSNNNHRFKGHQMGCTTSCYLSSPKGRLQAGVSSVVFRSALESPSGSSTQPFWPLPAFLHVLEYERTNMTHFPEVEEGVGQLISTMRCDNSWRASWPSGGSVFHLTELMVQAVRSNCTLTCSFIHEAGGQSSLCTESGVSPLHAALEAGHWNLARQMLKNLGGCLYVTDFGGRLPTTMMSSHLRQQLEQNIYDKERIQLEDLHLKIKDKVEKQQVQELLRVQKNLFNTYWGTITGNTATTIGEEPFNKAKVLLTASQGGMLQLIYLLVKVGGVEVDTQVDPTNGTTAIHQAASHGKSGSVLLLLSLGADPLLDDLYKQTAPHLAAMFGHQKAFELFR
ncbi:Serine/threonine-protein phosphatase 6 regulatory ankyrin repeat subunit C-like 1 [Homarus americanus]|uniref:Serine/threonine-protein phosphatase 6 regulatory ankyrin repeat subunit C-like 1 n=1 Tax=Homarus americanus TaxID=6706 RepID=A0A8J5JPD0_HOMAM|nr:Serine/threonine-protein phosphatase 6 regulatory ankyrin repeat subunit C-like 1 [Homarus americanus]